MRDREADGEMRRKILQKRWESCNWMDEEQGRANWKRISKEAKGHPHLQSRGLYLFFFDYAYVKLHARCVKYSYTFAPKIFRPHVSPYSNSLNIYFWNVERPIGIDWLLICCPDWGEANSLRHSQIAQSLHLGPSPSIYLHSQQDL